MHTLCCHHTISTTCSVTVSVRAGKVNWISCLVSQPCVWRLGLIWDQLQHAVPAINAFNLPHMYLVWRHRNQLTFAAGGSRLWNKSFNLVFLSLSLLCIWNRTYVHFLRHVPSALPVVSVGGGQTQQMLCALVCMRAWKHSFQWRKPIGWSLCD